MGMMDGWEEGQMDVNKDKWIGRTNGWEGQMDGKDR